MKNIAVIFAGGVGSRFGSEIPKQFLNIYGNNIIVHTINVFEKHEEIDEIYIGCIEEWIPYLKNQIKKHQISKVKEDNIVSGGTSGQDTIYKILKKASQYCDDEDVVLIHDGVRPIISDEEISKSIKNVEKYGSSVICVPLLETPIYSKEGVEIDDIFNRDNVYIGAAPQCFRLGHILEAHEKIRKEDLNYEKEYNGLKIIDSASLVKVAFDEKAHILKGNFNNIKITTHHDYFSLLSLLMLNDIENYFLSRTSDGIFPK